MCSMKEINYNLTLQLLFNSVISTKHLSIIHMCFGLMACKFSIFGSV